MIYCLSRKRPEGSDDILFVWKISEVYDDILFA